MAGNQAAAAVDDEPAPLVVAVFDFEKQTPGTLRYKERGDRADIAIGYLYVRKSYLKGKVPEKLEVVVTEVPNT